METNPKRLKETIGLKGINLTEESTQTRGYFYLSLYFPKFRISNKFLVINKIHLIYDDIIGSDLLKAHNCSRDYSNDHTYYFTSMNSYQIPTRTETVSQSWNKRRIKSRSEILRKFINREWPSPPKRNKSHKTIVINISDAPIIVKSNLNLKLTPIDRLNFVDKL